MKNKETMHCVCGKDITNLSCKEKNIKHQLCISCYQNLMATSKYKRELLGTTCLCGTALSDTRGRRRRGLCISCYSFLQKRVKHMSKDSAVRIMEDNDKKCPCGKDAQWRKLCEFCMSRAVNSTETIGRLKSLHKRQDTCLCGSPTRVVRGVCKECHAYIGYRVKKKNGKVGNVRKKKMKVCVCGDKATSRGLCNRCYCHVRSWNNRCKVKKEKKNVQ